MKLPTTNPVRARSTEMQLKLKKAIMNCIELLEKEEGYDFHPYERDAVLLDMIKSNHESYITTKFGHTIVY